MQRARRKAHTLAGVDTSAWSAPWQRRTTRMRVDLCGEIRIGCWSLADCRCLGAEDVFLNIMTTQFCHSRAARSRCARRLQEAQNTAISIYMHHFSIGTPTCACQATVPRQGRFCRYRQIVPVIKTLGQVVFCKAVEIGWMSRGKCFGHK